MRSIALAALLLLAATDPLVAGDAIKVLQERRTRVAGSKHVRVEHVALLKNTSAQRVLGLRVTVELYDTFGKLLWSRTVSPGPSSLAPGETASLSVTTPELAAYKKTVYRFSYRAEVRRRGGAAR